MTNPFDTIGPQSNDFWQNLTQFGLATMAAGAQPGARTLGAIGQGGLAAMQGSRENALARTQNQLYGAEAQSKIMGNAVALNQINMQRMALGLPPIDVPGQQSSTMPSQQSTPQQITQEVMKPSINNTGMPISPTAGRQVNDPNMSTTQMSPTPQSVANYDPQRLSAIGAGRAQPTDANEAAAAAPWATMMGFADRAKELNTYALSAPIEGTKLTAIAPGGAVYQNGRIVAQGAQDAVTPEGAKYRLPARAGSQPYTPDPAQTTGNLWSSPPPAAGEKDHVSTLSGSPSGSPAGSYNSPEGSLLTAIPPSVEEFKKGRGTDLSKKIGDIDEQAEAAKSANFLLDQMKVDAADFTPGKFANTKGELGKYIRTVNPSYDGSVAAYERFKKNAITLTNEEVRQVSNRAAVQEYQAIQAAQPQPDMSPRGIQIILDQKYAINDYKLAKQEAVNQWLQTHPTPEGFESDFNKKISPGVFLVSRMTPQNLQLMRTNILKRPEGQKILDNLMEKIQNAQALGVLQ